MYPIKFFFLKSDKKEPIFFLIVTRGDTENAAFCPPKQSVE